MALNSAVTDTKWSPNFSAGRPAGTPDKIVIHHWGADGQNHQTVVDFLCRKGGNSSAHYVASAGRVTQLVHDYDRAWHAGPKGNPRGIGIECHPEMTDADIETVVGLIRAIRAQWGDLPVKGHKDFMNTACPGRWYGRLGELSDRAHGNAPAPAPADTGKIAEDGYWGTDTTELLQRRAGTPVDREIWHQWPGNKPRLAGVTGSFKFDNTRQGSPAIKWLQGKLGTAQDGILGKNDINAMIRRSGGVPDGKLDSPSNAIKWLQHQLNNNSL